MKLIDYLKESGLNLNEVELQLKADPSTETISDSEYFDTLDPKTGFRFSIPLLNTSSPSYYWDYVNYMKTRAYTPETFEKIMGWN